jgi:DNA primase
VLNLLRYGVKNAVAVEGTNVPDAVADLTQGRTVTAFLDGDRGGDLIRKELSQVGDIDYVAFAPGGKSVEDLERHEVMSALRSKRPFEKSMVGEDDEDETPDDGEATSNAAGVSVDSDGSEHGTAATDGSARPAPAPDSDAGPEQPPSPDGESASVADGDEPEPAPDAAQTGEPDDADTDADGASAETLPGHVESVVDAESGTARLLSESYETLAEVPTENAFEALRDADETPYAVVLDGTLEQRLLDVAAQRGVGQIVAADLGEFVKQPTGVRVRTADQF